MTTAKEWLEDWLAKAAPDDLVFFVKYPPNLADWAISAADLKTLVPAPLPDQPPPIVDPPVTPPPVTPPPPAPVVDTLVVNASAGLSIRAQPSATATKVGALANGDTVEVSGSVAAGNYHYAQLMRVNGLKYAAVGFVAREYLSPKA